MLDTSSRRYTRKKWELLLRDPQHFSTLMTGFPLPTGTHCGNILLTYLLHWAHYVLLFVSA